MAMENSILSPDGPTVYTVPSGSGHDNSILSPVGPSGDSLF